MINPHLLALLETTLVTILWSSSFVLIKWGLEELPPFLFAGLRYFGGFLVLSAFIFFTKQSLPSNLGPRRWAKLAGIGITAYTVGNGLLFLALTMVPAVTASFIQGLIPLLVAVLGVLHLRERPSLLQAGGIGLAMVGAYIFFPLDVAMGQAMGIIIALGAALSFAYQMILVRDLSRDGVPGPLWLSIISLGIGGGLLFLPAAFEPLPRLTMTGVAILLWLAVANTAFAYV
ncbi:MAG: DMT family transporter, partial [Anaerolineae bacterium]|nr:DMT family transporter [Anaerolineae bacterium]